MADEAHDETTKPETVALVAVTTTAQVERTYYVEAEGGDEQARERLRSYLKDPGMLRPGVVREIREQQVDATPQRIKRSERVMEKGA